MKTDQEKLKTYLMNHHISTISSVFQGAMHETQALQQFLALQRVDAHDALYSRSRMEGHLTGSLLVLSPDARSVLTILHKASGKVLVPGGHVDPNEDTLAAAVRECQEETGIGPTDIVETSEYPLCEVFDIDSHLVAKNDKKNELAHMHHDYLYVCRSKNWALPTVVDDGSAGTSWTSLEDYVFSTTRAARVVEKVRHIWGPGLAPTSSSILKP